MQLRLAATNRDTELFADLLMGETFDIVEDEDTTGTDWEAGNGFLEIEAFSYTIRSRWHHILCTPLVVHVVSGERVLPAGKNHIHRHAMKPGREGGLSPEPGELLPGADEDILRHLFGERPISQHAHAQAEDASHMCLIDPLEGLTIAGRGGRDIVQFRCGHRGW